MTRFLLVRLSALGDVVHAIPVAAALRRAYPAARIDWLVGDRFREILDHVPVINRRLVTGTGLGSDRDPATSFFGALGELRQGRYDVAIDLQGLLKSAVLARLSFADRVIGFASPYLRERLARPFYTQVHDPGGGGMYHPADTHHVVRTNLGLLEPLGITSAAIEFPIERPASAVAASIREHAGTPYAVLNPGAAWPNKRWPPARFGDIARRLRDRYGIRSVVLWGPGEEALAQQVAAASDRAASAAPPTTIGDLIAILDAAALIVSGDTGPTHVAMALGTPVVGIYGPTRPSRNGPLSPLDVTVSRDAVCECHHLRRCRLETMCLEDISVDEVMGAIDRRLAAGHVPA